MPESSWLGPLHSDQAMNQKSKANSLALGRCIARGKQQQGKVAINKPFQLLNTWA